MHPTIEHYVALAREGDPVTLMSAVALGMALFIIIGGFSYEGAFESAAFDPPPAPLRSAPLAAAGEWSLCGFTVANDPEIAPLVPSLGRSGGPPADVGTGGCAEEARLSLVASVHA